MEAVKRSLAVLLVLVSLVACTFPQRPPPPEPIANKSDCEISCSRYQQFGCEEGQPTAKGATCTEVCLNAAESGIDLAKDVPCVQASTSCSTVRSCPE